VSAGEPALDARDRDLLDGGRGEAARLAMRLVVAAARAMDAPGLLDIASAHVSGCFYSGRAGLDFAQRLVDGGAQVAVPTTLNTGIVDLLHPELQPAEERPLLELGRRQMDLYAAMGCEPTWTCAPYQRAARPSRGEQVAWGESSAVVFANSVLGARTNKYGDFLDIACAVTGRVPDAGLHRDAGRAGRVLVRVRDVDPALLAEDAAYGVLGYLAGRAVGSAVPVIDGLPATATEDQLRALGAAAAAGGGVELFHAVGLTPEAPTLDAALRGGHPERELAIDARALRTGRDELSTRAGDRLTAVCLGTPHMSAREVARVLELLDGRRVHPDVAFYVSTGRDVLADLRARGDDAALRRAGVRVVVDTCTYFAPFLRVRPGPVMTDSAKWAYYAPGNLGVDVVFASTAECVRSAVEGRVWHDAGLWGEA
jgi:predicted aconitase